MTLDPYSLCPGGSGKKVKFCCGELIDDLNRLDKMIKGEQYASAIEQADTLLQIHKNNESLLALKTRLLRMLGRLDEANASAAVFLVAHPRNPVALAESAILLAIEGDGRGGLAKLEQALAVSGKEIYAQVYEAMGAVAAALLHEGEIAACRALLQLQIMIAREDREPLQTLVRINGSPSIPLLLKQDRPWALCPDDADWRPLFDEAMAPSQQGRWSETNERLTKLAADYPKDPAIWQNLAIIRDWLADDDGCVEALRKLATLDISREDAVETEALALLRSQDGFGDEYDVFELEYEVKDVDHLAASFSTNDRAQQVPVDYNPVDEDDVPPKSMFILVDRPSGDSVAGLEPQDISQVIGQAMLFGRQTDRAARLLISGVAAANVQAMESLVSDLGGEEIVGQPDRKTIGKGSAMQDLLRKPWYLPRDVTQAQLRELSERHTEHALLQKWPEMTLGCLDGKTPRQAAADSALADRVLALILILETTVDSNDVDFDFNKLREELGLPQAGPIDPQAIADGEKPDEAKLIANLPLVRLVRVEVEKLADDVLVNGFMRAAAFTVERAVRKFGEEILRRPALKGKEEENEVLRRLCRLEPDLDKRLQYIGRGRDNSIAAGKSCAMWDLLELPVQLERNDPQEMGRLIDHIQSKHIKEPGVADTLVQFLVQIGALRPDGTPATSAAGPQGPAPSPDESQSGKLWTPDGESAGGGEKPKLWTPGMD